MNHQQLADRLSSEVAALAEQFTVPGVAVAFDVGGEVFEAHHGFTHIEHRLPIDGDTLFQIASMSKPFAATVTMMLVQDGVIGLDDPVKQHLPEFATSDGRHDNVVTVRHLLTHTTGWDGDELLVRSPPNGTLDDAARVMSGARQLVQPGTDFTYNNGGFAVAGQLIERVTGRTFGEVLRDRVLEPIGLSRTVATADEAILHRVAMRHDVIDQAPSVMYDPSWQPGWGLAPIDLPVGGLISSTNDLLAWQRCWLQRGDADTLQLDRSTRDMMCEPHAGWYNPANSQGLGWALKKIAGVTVHGHGGLTAGYCSYSLFCPELDLAAVVLTNSTTGTPLCAAVTDELVAKLSPHAAEAPTPLDPQPDALRILGSYTGSFGVITVAHDEELTLTTRRHQVEPGEWQPEPEPQPKVVNMYTEEHGVVTSPPNFAGTLVDFAPPRSGEPAAWLRSGGRIHTRV